MNTTIRKALSFVAIAAVFVAVSQAAKFVFRGSATKSPRGDVSRSLNKGSPSSQSGFAPRELQAVVNTMNANCPVMLDRETRLDSSVAGPGLRITYLNTLVNIDSQKIDPTEFKSVMQPRLRKLYQTQPEMADLWKGNVTLCWSYRDSDGDLICQIEVTPNGF